MAFSDIFQFGHDFVGCLAICFGIGHSNIPLSWLFESDKLLENQD